MPEAQQQTKQMNLVQLTFIVAVNMMGSGIIMLPTNMAKVGAISLLSWVVTALGSMAIAYGFAQAGLFNQRPGGMSAYAEDAYGKSGYFLVFFLYFLSLAIGNVAIAISAVGYLAAFLPWLSSTPVATCIGVIALLWLLVNRTRTGKAVLAASMNPRGVTLLGLELGNIYVVVWAIYGILAGIAGVLLGMFLGVSSYSVGPLTASAFSIVVLGGLGSVSGSLIAAFVVGYLETLTAYLVSPAYRTIPALLLLVAVMYVRPQGLLGRR